jgi:hypothetical protein
MYLTLDAIDEFEYWENLYPFLRAAVKNGVKVFVTSRPIPDIEDAFVTDSQVEIKASRKDLQNYIESSLRESDVFNGISRVHNIVQAVVGRAGET